MKMELFSNFLTFILISMFYLPNAFAQDSPQWYLSEDAIARLGKGSIYEIASSPDGTRLAVASQTGTWLYDTYTGEELSTFIEHTDFANSVAFSSDGKMLASGSWRGITLWDVETRKLLQKLTGHTDGVNSVAFSPSGRTLASGSDDNTVRLWDVETGLLVQTLTDQLDSLFTSSHVNGVQSVAFSPDGKTLASAGWTYIFLWDVATGLYKWTLTAHTNNIDSVVFSPDGKTLASGGGSDIRLWDVVMGELVQRLTGHTGYVESVVFSADGKMLASASWHEIGLWDTETGKLLQTLTGHTDWIRSVVFSPDGKTLASGSSDGTIRLWDVEASLNKQTFTGHTDDVLIIFGIVCLIVAIVCLAITLLTKKTRAFLREHSRQLLSEDPKILLELSEKCDEYLKWKRRRSAKIMDLSQQAKAKAVKFQRKINFETNLATFKSEVLEDGSHPSVVSTLKEHMHNPDSFQHVSSNYEAVEAEGKYYCKIVMVYRGTNTFGALVLQTCFFVLNEDNQISLIGSPNDAESSSLNTVTLAESIEAASSLFEGIASAVDLLSLFGDDE